MTDQEKNVLGLAQFSYIAYEYFQSAEEELIRLGELHNSNKYRERFDPAIKKKIQRALEKEMIEENKHLKKSLGLFGKHLKMLVEKMDTLNCSEVFQDTNEQLYETFDNCIKNNLK